MGNIKYIDLKIARFLTRCLNYYIKKRTFIPSQSHDPTRDELWDSIFTHDDSFIFDLDQEIKIILHKESILCKNIYFGFEEREIAFVRKYLKRGDIVFDVGSNIGLYSLIASNIVQNEGKVFSFEPTPDTFLRLQQNIKLNKLTNITSYKIGISNQKTMLDLNISKPGYDAFNSFAILDEYKGLETSKVNVDNIDSFIQEHEIHKVDLVKIDVEGWEKFVLQGAKDLINTDYSPVFLVEFNEKNAFAAGYYLGDIYDYMTNFGYNWYSYNAKENLLINEKKKLHYIYENLIAIKNLENCNARISI